MQQHARRRAVARVEGDEDRRVFLDRVVPPLSGVEGEIARSLGAREQRLVGFAQWPVARAANDERMDFTIDGRILDAFARGVMRLHAGLQHAKPLQVARAHASCGQFSRRTLDAGERLEQFDHRRGRKRRNARASVWAQFHEPFVGEKLDCLTQRRARQAKLFGHLCLLDRHARRELATNDQRPHLCCRTHVQPNALYGRQALDAASFRSGHRALLLVNLARRIPRNHASKLVKAADNDDFLRMLHAECSLVIALGCIARNIAVTPHREARSSPMVRPLSVTALGLCAILAASAMTWPASADTALKATPKITLGFAKCAHCVPMSMTPSLAKGVDIEAIGFNSGNDVLTALISKSIDVAQVTYLHYVTALDKGFDVVAVTGQINGGSECLSANKLDLPPENWAAFKALVTKAKAAGEPLKVAASRGNAQDIHMRGAFLKQGIDPNKDIQFINIPNPADHVQALRRGDVDMVCTVEPFASQIRMTGAGKHFVLPYDQAAGNLTNLILTRSDVIANNRAGVQATVDAVVAQVDQLRTDQAPWIATINKVTGLDPAVAAEAVKNAAPDYDMHRSSTDAIAKMMFDLKYIAKDVTPEVDSHFDYSFLMKATGKTKNDLGY